ncbi:MAG TPA: hypothetical protein VGP93_18995, partial [Polyangiaceae bacterium]|nr:hypothetical protein [Polyangiaceae bacterium]
MMFRIMGLGEAGFAQPILDECERLGAGGRPIHLFGDLGRLDKYESQLRLQTTDYFRAHRAALAGIHVLVRSRLVAMGVAVA